MTVLLPLLFAWISQELPVTFDAAATQIHWTLGGNFHTVHGTFKLASGSVRFDPATGNCSGEFVADAASGTSGNGSRDKRMNTEILESAKFTQVVFVPAKCRGTLASQGTSHIDIDGMFTLHGTGHAITIPADVEASPTKIAVKAHFEIPYVEWGLRNPSNIFLKVDSKVIIDLETVGEPANPR